MLEKSALGRPRGNMTSMHPHLPTQPVDLREVAGKVGSSPPTLVNEDVLSGLC